MQGEVSETIFVVNQIGSGCYGFPSEPQIDKYGNWCGYGWFRLSESYMPPPGECWEYRLTRKGDIDTDGDPIGWKIVGIGKDGSVLCEKGNGQRRRYSFGDGAKEQPSGEAWEFCQRLVDMVGAEGPEDVQGMLDKVNAELHRLKQNIDSMSANLADKEGFLNSAGDEIEVLTKERDEALRELANERSRSGQVTTAQINVIAELQEQIRKLKAESATQTDAISEREDRIDRLSHDLGLMTKERDELRARLAKPEMPECVAKLLQTFQPVGQSLINAVQTVRDHYAPPFRIEGPGVYETEDGNPWEVIYIDPKGGVVARHETTKLLENFHVSGSCKGGNFSLTKYLRPLEG